MKDRVAVWSPQRRMSSECLRTLLQAVMVRSVVTIVYASSHGTEERDIQPIGLYASSGFWYCPAYCFQREAFRLFRADRIQSASLNREIPPREEVAGWTLWTTPMNHEREQITFTVHLTPLGVRLLESDRWFGSSIRQLEDGSGEASILVPIENLSFYTDLIWRLGEEALIVEPPQAVELIKAKLNALSARYNAASTEHQNS